MEEAINSITQKHKPGQELVREVARAAILVSHTNCYGHVECENVCFFSKIICVPAIVTFISRSQRERDRK